MLKMECLTEICAICGTTSSISKVSSPSTGSGILSLWKNECAKSLCDVLFDSGLESPFLQYFENGNYCFYCLQIFLDVNFTWKQLTECKRKIEEQSMIVSSLLNNNYNNRKKESEVELQKESISTSSDNSVNNFSSFKILEMIYFATVSKLPKEKLVRKDRTPKTKKSLKDHICIKEEHIELEFNNEHEHVDFDDHFVDGGEDWFSSSETSMNRNSSVSKIKGKKGRKGQFSSKATKRFLSKQEERKKRQESLQLFAPKNKEDSDIDLDEQGTSSKSPSKKIRSITNEEENGILKKKRYDKITRHVSNKQEESDSDIDLDESVVKDDDWTRTSYITNNVRVDDKGNKRLKKKLQEEVETDDSLNTDTTEDSNDDDNIESISMTIKKPRMKNSKGDKATDREEKMKKKRNYSSLRRDIILDDSEQEILKKLIKLKMDKHFRLKHLEETQLTLVKKLARYHKYYIQKLKLNKKEKDIILELKSKVRNIKYRKPIIRSKIFFECTYETCTEKLNTEEELEAHVREKHNGEKLPFYCTTCPMNFKTFEHVKSHRRTMHKGLRLLCYHFCKICQKGYKTEEELNTHSIAHQGPNPFSCAFCDKELTTSLDLVRHMNESHFEIPTPEIQKLTCDKCGIYCSTKATFNRHLKSHEKDIPPKASFNCDQCHRSFPSVAAVKYHIDQKHTTVICDICGKSTTKSYLRRHQLRHTRALKYECSVCGKRFMSHGQKTDHERIHSGIRSFICSVCGKGFFTKSILQGHEKTHEPGYIPRKPFRRTRPNRTKKIQEPIPETESRSGNSSQSNEQREPLHPPQNMDSNNYSLFHPQQPHNLSYGVIHPPGFMYPF